MHYPILLTKTTSTYKIVVISTNKSLNMIDYAPPQNIPQAVIELSDKHASNREDLALFYFINWKDYEVYERIYKPCLNKVCGAPIYILYDGKDARFATPKEGDDIWYYYVINVKRKQN